MADTTNDLKRELRKALMRKWSTDKLMDEFFNGRDCLNARQLLGERGYSFGIDTFPYIKGYKKVLDKK